MTLNVFVTGPTLVREGLRALLAQEEDFAVGTADGEANDAVTDRSPPDVIVCCDDAPDAVRDLRARWPEAGVLVIADLSPAAASRLNELGVVGLYPLSAEPDELIWAVRSVAQGARAQEAAPLLLHPTVLRSIVRHLAETEAAPPPPPPVPLTARERDVLRCLVLGASDKDIAQQLYLSVRTAQSHLAHLYHKLGVHSRTEAALVAVRAGWFAEESTGEADEFSISTEDETGHTALAAAWSK